MGVIRIEMMVNGRGLY